MADGATLDQELGQLLEQETFPPPDEFRERAVYSDPSIYDEAEADPEGFWAQQAEALHWDRKWDQVLDWSNPPFAKWFLGGKLNVSYNCLDRHVEAGLGERVAFHWRGEEGEERDVTYAALHADVQRFANALKDRGIGAGDVVGIYLPMIPEVAVAMLACARIGAVHNVVFGGFSAESVRRADGVLRGQGADHRRRRAAQGQDGADQAAGRRGDARPAVHRRAPHRRRRADGRQGRLVRRADGGGRRRVPGRAARRRAPAVHPLHVGLDGQAEGDPAHDRRLPDAGRVHAQGGLRPQARRGRLLVLGRRRLGHRALLHRLRAARQRRDVGDVRGRARLPGQGRLVGAVRALRRDDLLHRADRDPRLHQVGHGVPGAPRPLVAAAARDGRRADQPEGVALVPQGDRRRALPDRRHVVADRDRRDHDHDAAGHRRDEAGLGRPAAAGRRRRGRRRAARGRRHRAGLPHADAPVAGDAAHALQGGGALHRDVLVEVRPRDLHGRRRRAARRGRLLLDHRAHRRRAQRVGPPHVDGGDRVGDRLLLEGRRGGRDRAGRRGHRPVGHGVRDARGRPRRRRGDDRANPRARRRSGSASSRGRSGSSGPTTCRRRARARSCGGCCATSPRAASSAT